MMAIQDRMVGLYEVDPYRIMAFFVIRDTVRARLHDPLPRLKAAFGDLGRVLPETFAAAPAAEGIYCDVVAQVEMAIGKAGARSCAGVTDGRAGRITGPGRWPHTGAGARRGSGYRGGFGPVRAAPAVAGWKSSAPGGAWPNGSCRPARSTPPPATRQSTSRPGRRYRAC